MSGEPVGLFNSSQPIVKIQLIDWSLREPLGLTKSGDTLVYRLVSGKVCRLSSVLGIGE